MSQFEEKIFGPRAAQVDNFISAYFKKRIDDEAPGMLKLKEAIEYSVLAGGKRFRPVLAMLVAEALGKKSSFVLPYASAVEFIHTYSLIHDDLPCMDNDDYRRGKLTNHKVFGEATALLAGDALLTESAYIISSSYAKIPKLAVAAVRELSNSAGAMGMVGGQSIDMYAKRENLSLEELEHLHNLKTGELIKVAALGAAIICGANAKRQKEISSYAAKLGLAFQVKDDILDFNPDKPESGSFPSLIGLEKTTEYLNHLTKGAEKAIKSWGPKAQMLRYLVEYNESRTK
jgi:geranylgeranyl diphosphate synthase, type II